MYLLTNKYYIILTRQGIIMLFTRMSCSKVLVCHYVKLIFIYIIIYVMSSSSVYRFTLHYYLTRLSSSTNASFARARIADARAAAAAQDLGAGRRERPRVREALE